MKEYVSNYYGKKILQEDGTYHVELYDGDTVAETMINIPDENLANAMIIPWVVQEGNTQTDRNSETDPVDPGDDLFTRDFIKD